MTSSSIAWKVVIGVLAPVIFWLVCIAFSFIPWLQRHILYLHKAPMSWGERLDIRESFGFVKNQVTSFYITTPDNIRLYTWLITPLKLFADNEREFLVDKGPVDGDVELSAGFKLLKSEPESRLLIYFHGNTGTIGQGRRTDEYRVLSSGASDKMFILTFDYRGFGSSTGEPTEEGLVIDAISVVKWAMEVACIPPDRIVFLSQSLGTAVATAATAHFITSQPKVEFAGLILCAAFADAANVFLDFSVLGKLPLMAPIKYVPFAASWFRGQYKDTWKTSDRLVTIVKRSSRLRLTLFHSTSDVIIPWTHCQNLFYAAANAAYDRELTRAEIDDMKRTYDLGEGGWLCTWDSGDKKIKQRIVKYGGHDSIMKYSPVALLVLKAFDLN